MKLDILLRTHDDRNVHMIGSRSVDATKPEILLRCLNSLITSINAANNDDNDITLHVIDDHSKQNTKDTISSLLEKCTCKTRLEELELTGNNASLLQQYKIAKESGADLVYLVEDDYLHYPDAIQEMMDTWHYFTKETGGQLVCIHPIDDPDNYRFGFQRMARIIPSKTRLWRTNLFSTGTMCLPPEVLRTHWDKFETLALGYGIIEGLNEFTVWAPLWEKHVILFTPLKPLAYHLNEWTHPLNDHMPLWEDSKY